MFVTFVDNHHGDGRLAMWCAAPDGMQEALVAQDSEHNFVPPYVGHRGRIGVRLDRALEWEELTDRIGVAYRMVTPKALVSRLG